MPDPTPTTIERCSECGTPTACRHVQPPRSALHWTRFWPLVALIAGGVAVVSMTALTIHEFTRNGTANLAAPRRFLDPVLDTGDLRRAADGASVPVAAALLAERTDWLVRPPRGERFHVEMLAPAGRRTVTRSFGRPFTWVRIARRSYESDIRTREQMPIPNARTVALGSGARPVGRWMMNWRSGLLVHQPGAHLIGRPVTSVTVDLAAVSAALLVLAAAGWLARRVPRGGVVFSLAIVALAAWTIAASNERTTLTAHVTPRRITMDQPPPSGTTSFDDATLDAAVARPDGDARIARAILETAVVADGVVAVSTVARTTARHTERRIGWPLPMASVQRTERSTAEPRNRTFDGARVRFPAGPFRVDVRGSRVVMVMAHPHGTARLRVLHVHATGVAGTVFLLVALWAVVRGVCLGARALAVRHRVRRGRCVACGYPHAVRALN